MNGFESFLLWISKEGDKKHTKKDNVSPKSGYIASQQTQSLALFQEQGSIPVGHVKIYEGEVR